MNKQFFLFLILFLVEIQPFNMDDEKMVMDYTVEYIDPNDMLGFAPSLKRNIITDDLQDEKLYLEDGCNIHLEKINSLSRQLKDCTSDLLSSKAMLQQTAETINTLQDSNASNVNPAITSFYLRLLKSFWNLLEMEEMEKFLVDGEKKIEVLSVSISLQDIQTFKTLFNESRKHSEMDDFFYSNFKKVPSTVITPFAEYLGKEWWQSLANSQLWLAILGLIVLVLSCWALTLSIIDIQQNMRWTRIVGMIFCLLFVISCIGQWRIMVKNIEAKKRSEGTQVGPEDCIEPPSYLESFIGTVFGAESKCEKYHRQILVEASEEVTPLMAVTETISLIFLEPLQLLGTYSGLFFKHFYSNIPFMYAIPATIVFCLVLTAVLFASFGYGIDFPFFLGGIRPTRPYGTDETQLNHILEENRKHLREERNSLLNEAKEMLRDISIAAISHTQRIQNEAVVMQPFFVSSAGIIERQLEQIISKRFNCQLEQSSDEMKPADAVDCSGSTVNVAVPALVEHPQDDFVNQIKNILEDSFPCEECCSPTSHSSDVSESDPANKFLDEVRQVMTP